jgi:predicted AAA+ superfamily ATPase
MPKYFVQGQNSEIDMVFQNGIQIIPVEIKSGDSIKATSFKRYIAERNPKQAILYSGLGYKEQDCIINIPLYLACKTKELLRE